MLLRLKLAIRNTFRNRRRTALNILMISGGVATILLFQGLVHRMVVGLRETTIKTQTGHLQIATKSFWNKTAKQPKQSYIPNSSQLLTEIRKNPHVRYAAGRITFYGLIGKAERTISAQGVTYDPDVEWSRSRHFRFIQGHGISRSKPFQVALGAGLAKKLGIKPGTQAVVLANTLDGVVNAIDVEVTGIFRTAIAEFDDNTFLIPLKTAQKLLDTSSVEQIIIGLDDTSSTSPVKRQLSQQLATMNSLLQIRPWHQIAKLYAQVATFNRVQNTMFESIILSLILLSILNTVGMSILERTGEIGTLRAIGESRMKIIGQFVLEGVVLGVLGALVGVFLGLSIASIVNQMRVPIILPGASSVFYIEIIVLKRFCFEAGVLAILSAVVAALIPAIRASRLNIVEALRKNI